ncbi:hypothetical protein CKALI_06885 [Corynebacterium kalinowskii]|uniref:Mycothiol-dependent maleylpyruvate isomerase metal-binding domain-containing protein n=2 Tax=Corynebacterium kalinowskii TaxID=2675216 RepID=A0A6B8VGW1_9CORY|nr:hypothetical protein CKALI_06885 [Corynebacterium kalinowskii]
MPTLGRMSFSIAERARLVQSLLSVGPDAPTLCEGWTAHHLAAHLLIRERKLLATAGMFVPPLSGITDRAMASQLGRPFEDVVQEWGRGPRGAWKLIDKKVNVAEHFVHHEDVRRPQGMEARGFSTPEIAELYAALRTASAAFGQSSAVVELWPHGQLPIYAGDRHAAERVQIHGDVGELLLYTFGRPVLKLDFVGNEELVRRRSV